MHTKLFLHKNKKMLHFSHNNYQIRTLIFYVDRTHSESM